MNKFLYKYLYFAGFCALLFLCASPVDHKLCSDIEKQEILWRIEGLQKSFEHWYNLHREAVDFKQDVQEMPEGAVKTVEAYRLAVNVS